MICVQLSAAELAIYLARGYRISGGPYATQAQCEANCGCPDGLISVACPGQCLPTTLQMDVAGDGTYFLDGDYQPGTIPPEPEYCLRGGAGCSISFACRGGMAFSLDVGGATYTGPTGTCDPFTWTFTGVDLGVGVTTVRIYA